MLKVYINFNFSEREGVMSVEIKYDQNRNVLYVTLSGEPEIDEITSALENITNSGDYPPNTNAMWDIRNANISNANYHFVSELVKMRSSFTKRGHCRSALIVSNDAQYGLSRMFEMLAEGKIPYQLMIFRDYKEGEQWLLEKH